MKIMNALVSAVVLLAGIYLIGLAALAFVSPDRAKNFIGSFANSAFKHFLELFARLIAGAALVHYSPQMKFSSLFFMFGWIILATTIVLFLVPWRFHQRFAEWSVPYATQHTRLFGFGSFVGGLFVLLSFFLGPDPQ